ncbi:MAG: L-glutamate gamma-semialdehyde dehydrogenase [Holophagales bacterium]|nr:MAG: L-glutamate gamma-semialdehyde dehydrogenase [Holophagales bacterium]
MLNGIVPIPAPVNEPVRSYAPGSPEKLALKKRLDQMMAETVDVPLVIGGREVRTGRTGKIVCPHDHQHLLGTYHQAGEAEVEQAVAAAAEAWKEWSEWPWEARAAVLLKAADLLAGPWRDTLNAATMLNQSKTVFQAEIDSACELVDFWRYNPWYMQRIFNDQPGSAPGIWDYVDYRALEGFVFAVTPFNFTSIGGNLPTAPAVMGNVVLWKPASTAILSGYYMMKILEAAGVPPGVLNFLPGPGSKVGNPVFASRDFAGIHFTGSTDTFQAMWNTIARNLPGYRSYPRIVGETGGKDFIFAHPSADAQALAVAMLRGAFEYQGQKCSAASRAYVPKSLWPTVEKSLREMLAEVKMGSPLDFRNFMAAVIDKSSFDQTLSYIAHAKASNEAEIVWGGSGDDSVGYFVQPTVVRTTNPHFKLMEEEIFAPVLTVYVYEDRELDATLELCDTTSPYALTGAVFAQDRAAILNIAKRLRHAAGNFYINDKPTGAVVGQQPFGGARASGTNDKAGSAVNLLRWTSQRSIKENFVPPTSFRYPHQGEV